MHVKYTRKSEKNMGKTVSKEKMVENFPKLTNDIKSYIQRVSSKTNAKKNISK